MQPLCPYISPTQKPAATKTTWVSPSVLAWWAARLEVRADLHSAFRSVMGQALGKGLPRPGGSSDNNMKMGK
jgi:hypothetical protein